MAAWTSLATAMAVAPAAAQAPLPDPLAIDDAVRIAREERREVAAATSRADAATYRHSIVNVPDDPMLMAGIDHLPLPQTMGADWSVMIQQTFPLSDVLGARARVAEAEARRVEADVGRVALDVTLEARMAFFELYLARSLASLVDAQIELASDLVSAASARYSAAAGSQTEVLRADTELARLRAVRIAIDGRIAGAEGMLAAALAQPSGTVIPPLVAPLDDPTLDPTHIRALVTRALDARPELASSREAISRARSEIDVMQQMYFPMALVRFGASSTMAEGPGVMGMLGISIPIFRDRLDSGVGEARSMMTMSEDELAAMERMIEGEIASAAGSLRGARAQRDALRGDVVPIGHQAVDSALAQYGAAEVPQVTVVEAMRALFAVEVEALQMEIEAAMAEARLLRALGEESAP